MPLQTQDLSYLASRRSKMLSLRLSSDEYRALRQACIEQGIESISELARNAMHKAIVPQQQRQSLTEEVRDLRARVRVILVELERLSRRVEARDTDSKES